MIIESPPGKRRDVRAWLHSGRTVTPSTQNHKQNPERLLLSAAGRRLILYQSEQPLWSGVAAEGESPVMRRFAMTMAMFALAAGPALAAEPYVGTWSRDRLNCHAAADIQRQTVFMVDRAALSFPEIGCEHATFRKSATGWVVRASQCYGSDPALAEPFSRVIHIVRHGATVRFTWPGFDSGPLVRC